MDRVFAALDRGGFEPEWRRGRNGRRAFRSLCPVHDDHDPDLDVDEADDGRVLLICRSHHCPASAVAAAIGLREADLFPSNNGSAFSSAAEPRRAKRAHLPSEEDVRRWHAALLNDPVACEKLANSWGPLSLDALPRLSLIRETVTEWGVGIVDRAGDGLRLSFPVRDGDGKLRGVKLRCVPWLPAREPKSRTIGNELPLLGSERIAKADPEALAVDLAGEKDAFVLDVALRALDPSALPGGERPVPVTKPNGESSKLKRSDMALLKGHAVAIVLDADTAGDEGAAMDEKALVGIAREVRRVTSAQLRALGLTCELDESGRKRRKDVADLLLNLKRPASELLATIGSTRPAERPTPDAEASRMNDENPHLTDLGNARRLVAAHGRDLRFCRVLGTWLYWDGCRWQRDETGEVFRRADSVVRAIYAEAAEITDKHAREALVDHARRSENAARLRAIVEVAETQAEIAVHADAFDIDPWLLTVENGTIDLRTGNLLEHRREDLITKLAPVRFDPAARCPIFSSFIEKITKQRPTLGGFLQRLFGYSLVGVVTDHVVVVFYGRGANGKTTLLELMAGLLGEYARKTPFTTFLSRKHDGGPRDDLVRLKGARLVYSAESGSGCRLDEGTVKEITGGDKITARPMYGKYLTFAPGFKVFLATNNRPGIRDESVGMWRRVKLVPFDVEIPESEQDKSLREKLRAELPGILNWCLEGCRLWQESGLGEPTEVRDATAAYREEQDSFGAFFDERLIFKKGSRLLTKDLSSAYADWCKSSGEDRRSRAELADALRRRGAMDKRDGRGRRWEGVRLAGGDVVTSDDEACGKFSHRAGASKSLGNDVTQRHNVAKAGLVHGEQAL